MLLCGCDPGLDGALAFLDLDTLRIARMIGMPAMKLGKGKGAKREISGRTLAIDIEREVAALGVVVHCVYMERVQSSPQMGVASAFKFGRGYGTVEGVIAVHGWPIEYVTSAKWKKAIRCPAEKDDARERANQLLAYDAELWSPRRLVMTKEQASGRAEAALIALYGARTSGATPAGRPIPSDLFAEAV